MTGKTHRHRISVVILWLLILLLSPLRASVAPAGEAFKRQQDLQASEAWISQRGAELSKSFLGTPSDKSPLPYLEELAKKGDPRAQFFLGLRYKFGVDVSADPAKAFGYFEQAAAKSFAPADYFLGDCYDTGFGVTKNDKQGFELLQRAAKANFPPALHDLAVDYVTGQHSPRDLSKAFELYKQAAELGYLPSMHNLANCYNKGRGTDVDKDNALKWARRASEGGVTASYLVTALVLFEKEQFKEGGAFLEKSIKAEDPLAECTFVIIYFDLHFLHQGEAWPKEIFAGFSETESYTEKKIFAMAQHSFDAGYMLAAQGLGLCHYYAVGTSTNIPKAYTYFLIAYEAEPSLLVAAQINQSGSMLTEDEKKQSSSEASQYIKTHSKVPAKGIYPDSY